MKCNKFSREDFFAKENIEQLTIEAHHLNKYLPDKMKSFIILDKKNKICGFIHTSSLTEAKLRLKKLKKDIGEN